MKMEIQSSVSIVFLSLMNLCLCVQNFAEKTLNSFNIGDDTTNIKRHQHNHHHHHHHHHQQHQQHQQQQQQQQHHQHQNQQSTRWGHDNFLLIDYLADGEMERRISYKGITAKETTIGNSTSKSLSLWQLSNGKAFIQMIYSMDDELIDCEYVRQKGLVYSFLRKFYNEVNSARLRNFTVPKNFLHNPKSMITNREFQKFIDYDFVADDVNDIIENEFNDDQFDDAFGWRNLKYIEIQNENLNIPNDLKPLLNYQSLKEQCDRKQEQMKAILQDLNSDHEFRVKNATEHLERKKRALSDWLMVPNTKWCGKGHNADVYNQLGGASRADKCCRKHDHCKLIIHAMSSKWNLFNFRPFTISHCHCDMRKRRDLSSLLRVPGTKWCGKGWTAKKYSDMGGFSKADRCCRQHDKSCPFWITAFETKYGFFNWRINTIMHCKCDERFRTCLKMANSPDANMVGKLFFNVVQTKCFVLKPERVCKKRSYWGGDCEKKGYRKRAHLRDNRKF